jgi:tyrosinase
MQRTSSVHLMSAGGHGHGSNETFDDVIREGFPIEDFERARKEEESRVTAGAMTAIPGGSPVFIREEAGSLAPELQTAFKNAVRRMVQDGTYRRLVRHHMDMSHRMHGSNMIGGSRYVGLLRFLSWHRRYLQEFEMELRLADRLERPIALNPISIPYWRWSTPFPAWMNGFLPAPDPVTGAAVPARRLGGRPRPTSGDVLTILNRFSIQLPGQPVNDYVRFTYGLEGYGRRPNNTGLPAHNHVHDWIGGVMANVMKSPTDPMFWIHHAEVDRLWHIWQLSHGNVHPPLAGRDRILDPWPESYDDVLDVRSLGYEYSSITP